MNNRYTNNPITVTTIALFYSATGTYAAIYYGWFYFGVLVYLFSFGVWSYVLITELWKQSINYWIQVNEFIDRMAKLKDPEVRRALGFSNVASLIRIEVDEKVNGQVNSSYRQLTTNDVPAGKLQVFAAAVLQGKSTAEREWVGRHKLFTPKEYDVLMAFLKHGDNGFIKPKKTKNQGYEPTPKGQILFQQVVQGVALQSPYPTEKKYAPTVKIKGKTARTHVRTT